MVSIAFKLQVLPEKRQELMQTLEAIMEKTSVMKDCVSCALQQDPEKSECRHLEDGVEIPGGFPFLSTVRALRGAARSLQPFVLLQEDAIRRCEGMIQRAFSESYRAA